MAGAVRLRPATEADDGHLFAVYTSTRAEELALTGWTEEQKAQFCRMQYGAQTCHYRQHYPAAQVSVIEYKSRPAGRLYVDRTTDFLHIVDISVLPEYRGRGIGTSLLAELQEEARSAARPLRIHVEKFSRALELYRRLGFTVLSEDDVYFEMAWRPL